MDATVAKAHMLSQNTYVWSATVLCLKTTEIT